MAFYAKCVACMTGHHDKHQEFTPSPNNAIDGSICNCDGDCALDSEKAVQFFKNLFTPEKIKAAAALEPCEHVWAEVRMGTSSDKWERCLLCGEQGDWIIRNGHQILNCREHEWVLTFDSKNGGLRTMGDPVWECSVCKDFKWLSQEEREIYHSGKQQNTCEHRWQPYLVEGLSGFLKCSSCEEFKRVSTAEHAAYVTAAEQDKARNHFGNEDESPCWHAERELRTGDNQDLCENVWWHCLVCDTDFVLADSEKLIWEHTTNDVAKSGDVECAHIWWPGKDEVNDCYYMICNKCETRVDVAIAEYQELVVEGTRRMDIDYTRDCDHDFEIRNNGSRPHKECRECGAVRNAVAEELSEGWYIVVYYDNYHLEHHIIKGHVVVYYELGDEKANSSAVFFAEKHENIVALYRHEEFVILMSPEVRF